MRQTMRLLMSGGGTGGHILPNIALMRALKEKYSDNIEFLYVGDRKGMEKNIIPEENINFAGIFCGKIRRYFSIENFFDLLKVPIGVFQSFFIIRKFNPDVIFCKGGYVSFPVALGGRLAKKPVVLHESDVVPGLSNKIASRFSTKICVSYKESLKYFPKEKVVLTGNPVRKEISKGNAKKGRELCGFLDDFPTILVMGGSQGSEFINNVIFDNFNKLLSNFYIVHITGVGKLKSDDYILKKIGKDNLVLKKRYKSFDFVKDELKDLYAMSDLIVSRAGAVSLAEIQSIFKPAILFPLGTSVSRGDQIDNAKAFSMENNAITILEEDYSFDVFFESIYKLIDEKSDVVGNREQLDSTEIIINLLESL